MITHMGNRTSLAVGETYHIYNRGVHKVPIFTSDKDYERFMLLLFLANDENPINFRERARRYKGRTFVNMYSEEVRTSGSVDVLGYCLMPNHFHLILRQVKENGISLYMKKLCTAYVMYFNKKYKHSGVLFQGKFKSKHIDSEAYFRWIFSYIHLNPLDLFHSGWEEDGLKNKEGARAFINNYRFSSFLDFSTPGRVEGKIITEDIPDFLLNQNDFEDLVKITKVGPL